MDVTQTEPFVFKGRTFMAADLGIIREIVGTHGNLGRQELAKTIAELLEQRCSRVRSAVL